MKYWRKHVFKPLVYADGYMAPSLSKVSHSWLTMIKFSPSPSLHSSTLTPTFYIPTAAPWQPLALAPAEHWGKCSFLPHAHLHHWDSLQLHSTKPPSHCPWWQPWAVLSSQHQEDATCPGLGGSEILSVSLLPAMLWRGFSKLLIIQKPRAHIFCMQWFLLLNGSWCFTWRRAPFFILWIMESVQDKICLWEILELMWPDNRKFGSSCLAPKNLQTWKLQFMISVGAIQLLRKKNQFVDLHRKL